MNTTLTKLGTVFAILFCLVFLFVSLPWLIAFGWLIWVFIFGFLVGAGLIGLYWLLGKARLDHARAFATMAEASKIAESNSALLLPVSARVNIIQLPARPNVQVITSAGQLPAINQPELPTAPRFADLLATGWQPTPESMLLGYNQSGPLYGPLSSLLSTAVAGRPGQGKSSLLRLVAAQVALIRGVVVTLDPHGSIAEDVPGIALFNASTGPELDQAAYWLNQELDRRLADYRKGQRQFKPFMALNDEFPVISLASKKAVEAISRIVLEGRKVRMYSLISGQGLPANQFGGSLVRDALSSRYIFQTTSRQGQIAGLDKEAVKLLDQLDIGRAILDGPVKPQIVAIPFVEPDDLANLTRRQATASPGVTKEANPNSDMASRFSESPEASSESWPAATTGKQEPIVDANYRELPASNISARLRQAYQAFLDGATSVDKLATAIGCSTSTASAYLQNLERLGYIKRPGKGSV